MRKMKDSGIDWIGEIPNNKRVLRNKYMFEYTKGRLPESTNIENVGLPYIGASDLDSDNFSTFTTDKTLPDIEYNDLLVLWDGARAGLCGTHKKGKLSSTIVRIRGDKSVYQPFLYWYYKGFEGYMYHWVNGTTIPHMNKKYIEDIGMIDWSLSEQQIISNYLDSKCSKIDEYIAKQQQLIEKLKEYKQAIITEAVTKGLNPDVPMKDSGIEWIGEIPKHWKIAKVGYVTIKIGSGKTPKGGADVYSDEGVLFLRSQNIYNEGLQVEEAKYITSDIDEEMSNTRVYMNDVLLNITGGSIGRSCIYNLNSYANVNQHVCIIRTNDRLVLPTYMHYFWISHVGQISVDIHQTGANREGLNFEQISKTAIPILSLEEQKEISDYLDKKCLSINSTINQKQEIIDKLTEYKKSLIYEVVTGKKEV